MKNETKWRKTLYWLRRNFPIEHGVKVRRTICPKFGETFEYSNSRTLWIYIDNKTDFDVQMDTLLHEWAHCVIWDIPSIYEHSPEWGVTYAKIYNQFLEWDYGKKYESNT